DVNQFAIDGDNLMADFADKGWSPEFFQTNQIDVTIYGATDCPGSFEHNTKLAGYRALYLRNYFEVSEFPRLTIANTYSIPERNCVSPGQGYNRDDRVTSLKVCWSGDAAAVSNENAVVEERIVATKEEVAEPSQEKTIEPVQEIAVVAPPAVDSSRAKVTQYDALLEVVPVADSTTRALAEKKGFILPSKPKKIFTVQSIADFELGEEYIAEGLNFYPGSHHTLPEAKPMLKKLLQTMLERPTLAVEVQGHVCCASKPNEDGLDDETGDFKLSWNRAQFVHDYLIENGIDKSRVSFRGLAMTHPLCYPEKTIQDQITNRRVEILVTSE
ncbi:MAG: OmpA family protein, partial [Flavobacteriales bacterium]